MLEIIAIKKLLAVYSKTQFKTIDELRKFEKGSDLLLDRLLELEKMLNDFNE